MSQQTENIVKMIETVAEEHQVSLEKAYDMTLTWVAVQINVEEQLPTDGIKLEAYQQLVRLFDVESLRSEKRDWFGEAAEKLGIFTNLSTQGEAAGRAKAIDSITLGDKRMPKTVLIGNIATGRVLLELYNRTGDAAIFFAMEKDKRRYQTAVLNTHLHGIHANILFADNTVVDGDIGSGNWRFSNLWNPIKWEKLKPISS